MRNFISKQLFLFIPTGLIAQELSPSELFVYQSGNIVTISWYSSGDVDGYTLYHAPYPQAEPVSSIDVESNTISGELPAGPTFYVAVESSNQSARESKE